MDVGNDGVPTGDLALPTAAQRGHAWRVKLVMAALLLASTAVNLILTERLRDARSLLSAALSMVTPPVGWPLRSVSGTEIGPAPPMELTYSFPGRVTLLLVDDPACLACAENQPFWRSLVAAVRRRRPGVKIVLAYPPQPGWPGATGLTLGPGAGFALGPVPDVAMVAKAGALAANRLNYTPATVVADTRGRVASVSVGPLGKSGVLEVTERIDRLCMSGPGSACSPE